MTPTTSFYTVKNYMDVENKGTIERAIQLIECGDVITRNTLIF